MAFENGRKSPLNGHTHIYVCMGSSYYYGQNRFMKMTSKKPARDFYTFEFDSLVLYIADHYHTNIILHFYLQSSNKISTKAGRLSLRTLQTCNVSSPKYRS